MESAGDPILSATLSLSKSGVRTRTACVVFPEIGWTLVKAAFKNLSILLPAAAIAANPAKHRPHDLVGRGFIVTVIPIPDFDCDLLKIFLNARFRGPGPSHRIRRPRVGPRIHLRQP